MEEVGLTDEVSRMKGHIHLDNREFYMAVVQSIPLFGLETWVIYPCIGRMLGIFHQQVINSLTGQQPRLQVDGSWV